MNEELGEKKVSSSGVSIARRNLKELEHQMVFYDELPKKVQGLHDALDGGRMGFVDVYVKWQEIDDWRQKMLHEVRWGSVRGCWLEVINAIGLVILILCS
jgi:exocyst complex component 3